MLQLNGYIYILTVHVRFMFRYRRNQCPTRNTNLSLICPVNLHSVGDFSVSYISFFISYYTWLYFFRPFQFQSTSQYSYTNFQSFFVFFFLLFSLLHLFFTRVVVCYLLPLCFINQYSNENHNFHWKTFNQMHALLNLETFLFIKIKINISKHKISR